ncbi:OLC1v1034723C1 [Oldenlandia corymbosa var. corymbosa]|uniref:OLC1v1034723C1 n=1 Tax=Oldenlandia corymbosa var. corymbosa TaxID=529605 RepID=A0AAV1CSJ7_OLDCO|nr:OLC1v1034723C1 [Oldenlandia corymbosa var. corymbosa]
MVVPGRLIGWIISSCASTIRKDQKIVKDDGKDDSNKELEDLRLQNEELRIQLTKMQIKFSDFGKQMHSQFEALSTALIGKIEALNSKNPPQSEPSTSTNPMGSVLGSGSNDVVTQSPISNQNMFQKSSRWSSRRPILPE